jgi:uncharacterized membrane protein
MIIKWLHYDVKLILIDVVIFWLYYIAMIEKGKKTVAITVRMPESVKDRIYTLAQRERRSINSEIVHLLEASLSAQPFSTPKKAASKK